MTPTSTPATRTVLRAEGFSCPSCVTKIEKQVGRLAGVDSVKVHFASARVEVVHDPARVSADDLVAAVAMHDVDRSGPEFAGRVDHVGQHRPAGDLLQDLGQRGTHALAFAGGEDDDVERGAHDGSVQVECGF